MAATDSPELVEMMVGRRIESLFPKVTVPIGEPAPEVRAASTRLPRTKGVSLTVRAGEIVRRAGLVGSGRSELAQVVFGATPATGGEYSCPKGKTITAASPGEARLHGIAYVPEDRGTQGLVRPMSVRENMSLSVLRKVSSGSFLDIAAEERLAHEYVARLGIRTAGIEVAASKLSGGNQQKIVVGKWLATQPKVLILDEPTRGIDVGAKAEIHKLMGELASRGLAILMISSELPEVLGMSDRVLVMREGSLVAEFSRADATQSNVVSAMMGGDERAAA